MSLQAILLRMEYQLLHWMSNAQTKEGTSAYYLTYRLAFLWPRCEHASWKYVVSCIAGECTATHERFMRGNLCTWG